VSILTLENKESDLNENNNEVIKEEINLQFHWYLFTFFIIIIVSFLLPGVILMLFILFFFVPFFLETSSFFALFTEWKPLLAFITMPFVIIGCYLLHLFFVALFTRMFWRISEKISPTKDGIIPRNIPSKTLNFYHIRSFMIKYGKNVFIKGAFPWLANWFFNFVGSNKIGKGTTIEEQVCADKYIRVGNNSYIGVNCVLTSHLVEGIFGNTVFFELKVGDNVTLGGFNCFASGCDIKDDSYLLPTACGGKFYTIKGKGYYFGAPVRKIFKKRIKEFLGLTKEDLARAEALKEKRKASKKLPNKKEDNEEK